MATTSRTQSPPRTPHKHETRSEHPATSSLKDYANIELLRAIRLVITAALCNALAGQTLYEMSNSKPWWLGHAASLTLLSYGIDLVNRSDVLKGRGAVAHLAVVALGWALNGLFSKYYNSI